MKISTSTTSVLLTVLLMMQSLSAASQAPIPVLRSTDTLQIKGSFQGASISGLAVNEHLLVMWDVSSPFLNVCYTKEDSLKWSVIPATYFARHAMALYFRVDNGDSLIAKLNAVGKKDRMGVGASFADVLLSGDTIFASMNFSYPQYKRKVGFSATALMFGGHATRPILLMDSPAIAWRNFAITHFQHNANIRRSQFNKHHIERDEYAEMLGYDYPNWHHVDNFHITHRDEDTLMMTAASAKGNQVPDALAKLRKEHEGWQVAELIPYKRFDSGFRAEDSYLRGIIARYPFIMFRTTNILANLHTGVGTVLPLEKTIAPFYNLPVHSTKLLGGHVVHDLHIEDSMVRVLYQTNADTIRILSYNLQSKKSIYDTPLHISVNDRSTGNGIIKFDGPHHLVYAHRARRRIIRYQIH